jgi:hypothetical protein
VPVRKQRMLFNATTEVPCVSLSCERVFLLCLCASCMVAQAEQALHYLESLPIKELVWQLLAILLVCSSVSTSACRTHSLALITFAAAAAAVVIVVVVVVVVMQNEARQALQNSPMASCAPIAKKLTVSLKHLFGALSSSLIASQTQHTHNRSCRTRRKDSARR